MYIKHWYPGYLWLVCGVLFADLETYDIYKALVSWLLVTGLFAGLLQARWLCSHAPQYDLDLGP